MSSSEEEEIENDWTKHARYLEDMNLKETEINTKDMTEYGAHLKALYLIDRETAHIYADRMMQKIIKCLSDCSYNDLDKFKKVTNILVNIISETNCKNRYG